jgi:hypothetical protein
MKIPITVRVSRRVPERIWRDALANLGEMQKEAISRGIGTDWKCEFRDKQGIFFVCQKDTEFMIYCDGDEPQDINRGLRIKATAYAGEPPVAAKPGPKSTPKLALEDYRDQVIREMKKLANIEPSQKRQFDEACQELVRYYENAIGVGFLGELPARDTARHIIDSVGKPR